MAEGITKRLIGRRTFLQGGLSTATFGAAFAQTANEGEVKLGIFGPFTGVGAPQVALVPQIAQLAVDEINASGGVLGRPLKLVFSDDKTDPAVGVEGARSLVADGVKAAVGGQFSNIRYADIGVYEKAQIPYIYTTFFEGRFCSPVFYFCGETAALFQRAIQTHAKQKYGGGSWYHVGSDYTWSQINDAIVRDLVPKFGGQVVGSELLPLGLGGTDLSAFAERINKAKPDFIIDSSVGTDAPTILRQEGDFGIRKNVKAYYHVALVDNGLPAAGEAAEGVYEIFGYFHDLQTSGNIEFLRKYKARFGEPKTRVSNMEENFYDGIWFFKLAAEKAGSLDGVAILKAFEAGGLSFDGPRGRIIFDGGINYSRQHLHLAVARGGVFKVLEDLGEFDPKDIPECTSTVERPIYTKQP
jgi:urea transport system substrate-binding protein